MYSYLFLDSKQSRGGCLRALYYTFVVVQFVNIKNEKPQWRKIAIYFGFPTFFFLKKKKN